MERYWHHITPDVYSLPAHLNPHPRYWSRDDVTTWADWCRKEFSLDMKAENFSMNGKALCMLTKDDFKKRAPEAGDVLFNTLETLLARAASSESTNGQRWRSPGFVPPFDMVVPPNMDYNPYLLARYGRSVLPLCDTRSPPTSPMGGSLSVHTPESPAERLAVPPHAFIPWDYRTHQRPSPHILPLSSSPESEKHDSSYPEDKNVSLQNIECNKVVDYTSKSQTSGGITLDMCKGNKEHRSQSLSPQPRKNIGLSDRHGSPLPKSIQMGVYPVTGVHSEHIKHAGDVAVYENRPQTYHVVKTEPEDGAARHRSLHVPVQGGNPMAPPYDHISPPSSPDSQVLPSPVEDERVSPEENILGNTRGFGKDEDSSSWAPHFNSTVPYLKGSRKLWEFLWGLMENPSSYKSVIRWEDKSQGVFRILNTTVLAQLWGRQKNKNNMTYEKMSRALRYYYRMNILNKVPGKRLTYRFATDPNGINDMKRWARMNKQNQQDSSNNDMDR